MCYRKTKIKKEIKFSALPRECDQESHGFKGKEWTERIIISNDISE